MHQTHGDTTAFSKRAKRLEVSLERIANACDPLERLRALIYPSAWSPESPVQTADQPQLLALSLEFARTQFTLLGKCDANELAADFIARLCGAFTLGSALGDADGLQDQLGRIELWLEGSIYGAKRV